MKREWHFPTKVNTRDIQNCNCFWVPSYDLFPSARKAVFPAPTATGVHSSADNHVLSTSQIQWNWKWSNGVEAEAETMEFENGERCESIANAILSCLAENNIDVAFARGQDYDGASAMSSEACSVQGRIKKIAPMALYTHCNTVTFWISVLQPHAG